MKAGVKQLLQFIVFFGLGIGLTYWQFSGLDQEQKNYFFYALRTANYFWVVLAIIIGALAHWSRATRWKMLLTPLGHKTSFGNRFYSVMIGYLANYGIPRSGEVIRCTTLKTNEDVPFGESFGTVIVERLVDTFCLLLVFVIVLLMEFSQLSKLWKKFISDPAAVKFGHIMEHETLLFVLIAGAFLFLFLLFAFGKKLKTFFRNKFSLVWEGFKNGFSTIKRLPNPGLFIFHSLFIWSCYYFSTYVCFFAFKDASDYTLHTALIVLLFGTFGVIFTPGGIGAYQIIVTNVLFELYKQSPLANSTAHVAAPYSWLSWGAQVGTVVIFTGVAFALRKTTKHKTT